MCHPDNTSKNEYSSITNQDNNDYNDWFREQVERGILDAKLGRVISHEEVEERARLRREKLKQKLSK